MNARPRISTRTYTLAPSTTLVRSRCELGQPERQRHRRARRHDFGHRPRDLLRAGVLRCGNEVVQPAGQGTPGVGRSRRVRSRGVGYDATCLTKKEEPMARKPDYDFERKERERLKSEKQIGRANV